ncbi:hypothetical protein EQ875_01664 [Photobacterium damselae subsp. damselae]|uniref:reverse transcriptase/maturase family protein n=1 Tax=Photobacterium damselae TaxID=38293 RepID=UPI00109B9C56|nr:reverse transcriptase/maturase family protein [Photobacterium damselae]TGZ35383.1 hypothetical protein EQ875_01664 [Photobacterium damselae subsp. damselae]
MTLFEQITQFDNIYFAAHEAAKNKRFCNPIMKYMTNLEENVINTQNHLQWKSYRPKPHRQFFVYEPKQRLISAPAFEDRVVHHAICRVIEPIIDKRFIYDSYACRRNKGAHLGADRVQHFMRITKRNNGKLFALKADISKYFNSINHIVLKRIISEQVNCPETVALLNQIVDASPTETPGTGIPIGNLTSQLFANMYLNELDRFVKHVLGEKYYIRYMDDFCVIHHDKQHLHNLRKVIEDWLWRNLILKTNHKTQVFPIHTHKGRSLDFLGYRIYPTHRLLRKCSTKRMKHKLKCLHKHYERGDIDLCDITPVIASFSGHAKHANSHRLIKHILAKPFIRKTL